MSESDLILQNLKEGGFRLTRVRKAVVEAICSSKSPLSAADLSELLDKKEIGANKTTIYREIDFLVEKGIAVELDLMDGRKRYELNSKGGQHHHLVCTKCHDIKCVEMEADLDLIEKKIQQSHQFKIQNQVREFFGICADCDS